MKPDNDAPPKLICDYRCARCKCEFGDEQIHNVREGFLVRRIQSSQQDFIKIHHCDETRRGIAALMGFHIIE